VNIPTGQSDVNYTFEAEDVSFRLATGPTRTQLQEISPRHLQDYLDFKEEYVGWFINIGKNPNDGTGYSERTVEQISMKTDQMFRYFWKVNDGYVTELNKDKADQLMKAVERGDWGSANILNFKKTVKRYFKWLKHKKDTDHTDWECPIEVSEKERTNRDYFRAHEFPKLYNATLNHGSVKPYGECTPEERDAFKAHLAQRFEMPKEDVSRSEFNRANSWKVPSLVATALDMGLRPVEIGNAKLDWVNLNDNTFDIPASEASKSDNNWKCSISSKTASVLERWIDERAAYEKYDGKDNIWLNHIGTPYNSKSLNYLLDKLIEGGEIEPMNRNLTWYSIRHGVATLWANKYGIQHAREQLRHEKIETTMRYVHSDSESRSKMADDSW
jgi:integrase